MKKVQLFLLLLASLVAQTILAQPILVVSAIDSQSVDENSIVVYGELKSSKECGILFVDKFKSDHGQLHMLYKGKIFSIFPKQDIKLNDFFYGKKDYHWPKLSIPDNFHPLEQPMISLDDEMGDEVLPFSADYISKALIFCTDEKTGKFKYGEMIDGEIIIEYWNRTRGIVVYISKLEVDWYE